MRFIVMGGGYYGSYFCRQLLRGGDKLGLEEIVVVDHERECQVRRELDDPRLTHVTEDWHEFFLPYFHDKVDRAREGKVTTDHYVPPCLGPHFIFELFEALLKEEQPKIEVRHLPVEVPIGTPLDMKLVDGNRALSFATWKCPHSCIEPPLCPVTRGEKSWDMEKYLPNFFKGTAVNSWHLFPCRHLAMGVGTIPMQLIVDEYLKFSKAISQKGNHLAALVTHSSCHGLMGFLEIICR